MEGPTLIDPRRDEPAAAMEGPKLIGRARPGRGRPHAGSTLDYWPVKTGRRFSRKARIPSI
jgi:hypothetical protein